MHLDVLAVTDRVESQIGAALRIDQQPCDGRKGTSEIDPPLETPAGVESDQGDGDGVSARVDVAADSGEITIRRRRDPIAPERSNRWADRPTPAKGSGCRIGRHSQIASERWS